MKSTVSKRALACATAFVALATFCFAPASAEVDMVTGIRFTVPAGSVSDCSAKAKSALSAALQNVTESAATSGDWSGSGAVGASGPPTSAATVRCYPLKKGFVVTFTCVVQTPGSPYNATALCTNISNSFQGKPTTALATPPPPPSGCTTQSLVGTWTSSGREKSGMTFKMDLNGDFTDSDGISGNWILYGMNATLTYYGNHSLTLSADGKHLSGDGYYLTRKC